MSRYQHTPAEARIIHALAHAPYSALVTSRIPAHQRVGFNSARQPCPIAIEDVALWLEVFAEVVGESAERDTAERNRLRSIETDVNALRRLLGIGPVKL